MLWRLLWLNFVLRVLILKGESNSENFFGTYNLATLGMAGLEHKPSNGGGTSLDTVCAFKEGRNDETASNEAL